MSSVSAGVGPDAARAFRHRDASFSGKFHALLQRRLFLSNVLGCGIGGLAFAASVVTFFMTADADHEPFFDTTRVSILSFVLGVAGLALLLRRRNLPPLALHAVDAVGLAIGVLGPIGMYAADYEVGQGWRMQFVIIVMLTRAVFVPSRALRTFVLSSAAPLAWLGLELAHGDIWLADGIVAKYFAAHVVWNQIVLWLSVGLATYASHVGYALRLAAYEATRVGQYELEAKIGEGAMGEVWRARHAMLRRPTAIKLIRPEIADEKTRRRFEQEVLHTCRLSHPNVVAVYDFGHTEDGTFFYAMELIDGEDLGRIVRDRGAMPAARVIHVLVQACEALADAHAASLVHRDVKAGNLMLCRRGLAYDVVKVMDFGLVKDTGAHDPALSAAGEACGTPETISPEAARGRPVGPASDLYSLGALGCWLLTGRHVFDAATAIEFVIAHVTREPTPPSSHRPDVPQDLEAILLSCLRKDPAARPSSALELRDALLACRDAGRWTQSDAKRWWTERHPAAPDAAAPAA